MGRERVPKAVTQLKMVLNRSDVVRGTGYYLREDSKMIYCAWRDKKCIVSVLLCTVHCKVKDATGSQTMLLSQPW